MKVEICIESLAEAKLAAKCEANRVELCSALDLGGLTPSPALIEACAGIIDVHVLIRPRSGNFNYTDDELTTIKKDIEHASRLGAKGVVFGILNSDNEADLSKNRAVLDLAKSLNLEATFHRAFDLTHDPQKALDQIIEMGFDRLLTSGQQLTAIEGIGLIRQLVKNPDGQIEIMAGSVVNESNVLELIETGVDAVHFSSRKKLSTTSLEMGTTYIPDEGKINDILEKIKLTPADDAEID